MPLGYSLRRRLKVTGPDGTQVPVWTAQSAEEASYSGEINEALLYERQAMRYSRSDLVYMCVQRVAAMCAMLAPNLRIFDSESERDPQTNLPTKIIEDHPFLDLWRRPNPWDSSFEFLEGMAVTLQLAGNVFVHLDDGVAPKPIDNDKLLVDREKPPIAMWLMRPDRVEIKPSATEYIGAYMYTIGGRDIVMKPSAVRHFKRFHPMKDYEGLSPIEAANWASASDIAAQKANWSIFKNSMRLSGIVESDRDEVDPEQMQLMKKHLKENYTGDPEKAHQLLFMWQSFKYKEMGMNPRDAEFIEGSKLNRIKVFGVLGVHPGIILSEDVNLANALIAEHMTVKFTVAPMLERLASDISTVLDMWNKDGKADHKYEAHFVDVVPKDEKSRAEVSVMQAKAAGSLILALGPTQGVEEAQRQGLLSDEVKASGVPLPGLPGMFGGFGGGGDEDEEEEE